MFNLVIPTFGNSGLAALPRLTSFLSVCASTRDFASVSTSACVSGWVFLSVCSSVLVSTPVGTSVSASVCSPLLAPIFNRYIQDPPNSRKSGKHNVFTVYFSGSEAKTQCFQLGTGK